MDANVTISRYRRPNPKSWLIDGRGFSGAGSPLPPGATSGAGAAWLVNGATTVEKYGNGGFLLPNTDNLYAHVYAFATTTAITMRVLVSHGSKCDAGAPIENAQAVVDWAERTKIRTVNIKKTTDGSFGQMKDPNFTPTGNYIKLFEASLDEEQFTNWVNKPQLFYGVLFATVEETYVTLGNFRDSSIWLYPTRDETIYLIWKNAYNAANHEETLHVIQDDGTIVHQIRIGEDEPAGQRDIILEANKVYQLVIPGYSYRNYSIKKTTNLKWLWEPSKLQFSSFLPDESRVYFIVQPGEQATFCMKNYNRGAVPGPAGVILTRVEDDLTVDFQTTQKQYYYEYDTYVLPVETVVQQWRAELIGAGRTAVWLDGIPNVFSESLSWYSRPVMRPSSVTAVAATTANGPVPIGFMPKLGSYTSYGMPPVEAYGLIDRVAQQTTNYYSFCDVMALNPHREDALRELFSTRFNIKRTWTIFAYDGRDAVLKYNESTIAGVEAFIQNLARINDGGTHFVSLGDEPNYNYPDFETFDAWYGQMSEYIYNHPLRAQAGIKLSVPASSRFDQAPNSANPPESYGEDWCRMLIEKYGDRIEGIVWHEWTVRNPLNAFQYARTIEKAYKYSNNGARQLCIEQTNTAGGSSVSLYDQNTHDATIWWASVLINCAKTGKLSDLMWFPLADEPTHPKGLAFTNSETSFELKPVGLFVEQFMLKVKDTTNSKVYKLEYPGVEVDFLYFSVDTATQRKYTVMGVSKTPRVQTITLKDLYFPLGSTTLKFFTPDSVVIPGTYTPGSGPTAGSFTFTLPPQNIFFLDVAVPL